MSDKLLSFFESFAEADEKLEIKYAHEELGEEFEVIPTGSLALDDALSCGGYPCGRVTQLYAEKGVGKSLLCILAIKEAQKKDPEAKQLFIDAEGTFDKSWAHSLGVDTSKVILIEEDLAVYGQRCFEMLLGVPKADKKGYLNGKSKPGLLDKIADKEININFIVYDSLGVMIPPMEDVAGVGQNVMMTLPRFMSKEGKKLSLEVKKANIPFIFINHKRDGTDMYGPDHKSSGGNTWHHILSANIYLTASRAKENQIFDERSEKIGHTIIATVEKSKFGPWPRKAEFDVVFSKGITSRAKELLDLGLKYGVINNEVQGTYEFNGIKYRPTSKFVEAVESDSEISDGIVTAIQAIRKQKLDEQRAWQESKKQANIETEKKGRKRKNSASEENSDGNDAE